MKQITLFFTMALTITYTLTCLPSNEVLAELTGMQDEHIHSTEISGQEYEIGLFACPDWSTVACNEIDPECEQLQIETETVNDCGYQTFLPIITLDYAEIAEPPTSNISFQTLSLDTESGVKNNRLSMSQSSKNACEDELIGTLSYYDKSGLVRSVTAVVGSDLTDPSQWISFDNWFGDANFGIWSGTMGGVLDYEYTATDYGADCPSCTPYTDDSTSGVCNEGQYWEYTVEDCCGVSEPSTQDEIPIYKFLFANGAVPPIASLTGGFVDFTDNDTPISGEPTLYSSFEAYYASSGSGTTNTLLTQYYLGVINDSGSLTAYIELFDNGLLASATDTFAIYINGDFVETITGGRVGQNPYRFYYTFPCVGVHELKIVSTVFDNDPNLGIIREAVYDILVVSG